MREIFQANISMAKILFMVRDSCERVFCGEEYFFPSACPVFFLGEKRKHCQTFPLAFLFFPMPDEY